MDLHGSTTPKTIYVQHKRGVPSGRSKSHSRALSPTLFEDLVCKNLASANGAGSFGCTVQELGNGHSPSPCTLNFLCHNLRVLP